MEHSKKPKCSVFIAMTLDGYISRKNGDIDWLMEANQSAPEGEDGGYKVFMNSIDTIVMGRNTFEQVLTFEPWPYEGKKMVVMSSKKVTIPEKLQNSVTATSNSPADVIKSLAENGTKGIYVDGGLTIQSFLAAGLIDEMTITIIPVLIGSGKSLFGSLEKDVHLELIETCQIPGGFVQMKYKIQ